MHSEVDEMSHRGVYDEYHLQRGVHGEDDDGNPTVHRFYALAKPEEGDTLHYVGFYHGDRIDNLPASIEDASNVTTVGVTLLVDGTEVELKTGDVGRDWPAWWGKEREVQTDEWEEEGDVVVDEI